MRVFPIITALLVITGLYLLLFERQAVLDFARGDAAGMPVQTARQTDQSAGENAGQAPARNDADKGDLVSVIALRSKAQEIDSAVLLRGRTEASRQVAVKAETSGQVISEPRAKGAWVEAGDALCQLDPGTRQIALAEAQARLAEARARIPEAQARVSEAKSRVPAARAALAEARSRVPSAEAALANAKSQVSAAEAAIAQARAQIPAAEAALTNARAQIPAAEARLAEARARLSEAETNLERARKLQEGGFASDARVEQASAALESARAGVQNALSQLEAARAGVQSALSQLEAAKAGLQAAMSQKEGALAGVQSALSQVEAAKAGIESAKSQIEAASAGVQSAQSGVENAKAGVQSAEARVASVERDIENLTITAPFAGLLESDAAELGALLQPGQPCATLVQLDPIKLVGFVPEGDVAKVHTGIKAGGRLGNGRELIGTVSFLSRVSDPLTRTFRVEIEVANPDHSISDGLTVEMLIPSDGRMAHLLPQSALTLDDAGALGVRIVAPGTESEHIAKFAPVEMIRDTVEGVWVAGLPDEVSVIVVGQNYVVDGVALDVTWREPDA